MDPPRQEHAGLAEPGALGREKFFVEPRDSDEIDGGQLRDFVPGGLRSSAREAPASLLYQSPPGHLGQNYPGGGAAANDDVLLSSVHGGGGGRGVGSTAAAATTMSIMSPIFHFTSHDTTIVAMEHSNHSKLLALVTSKNEVFVTLTQLMPVVEDVVAVMEQNGPTLDERLQDWDPAAMSVLVDRLPFPCTQLRWAPWQHGVYLAAICPGQQVRISRYSHGRWALDAAIVEPADCLAFAFSAQFTLACACRGGRIVLLTRRATPGEDSTWTVCHRHVPTAAVAQAGADGNVGRPRAESPPRRSGGGGGGGGSPAHLGDCLSADFDESGSLLAVVHQHACVRVYAVTNEGTKIGHVVFAKDGVSSKRRAGAGSLGGYRQVAWSPSAGRSFLILAIVFPNRIHLLFFRRPRHLNAAGMPANMGSAAGGARGSVRGGAVQAPPQQLQLLAESTAMCEEVAKLSWNTTGTRFVTSHSDSSVHVWALDITYQQTQQAPLATLFRDRVDAADGGMAGTSGGGPGAPVASRVGPTPTGGRPDQKLNLVVAIRKASSIYPYHALNAK